MENLNQKVIEVIEQRIERERPATFNASLTGALSALIASLPETPENQEFLKNWIEQKG